MNLINAGAECIRLRCEYSGSIVCLYNLGTCFRRFSVSYLAVSSKDRVERFTAGVFPKSSRSVLSLKPGSSHCRREIRITVGGRASDSTALLRIPLPYPRTYTVDTYPYLDFVTYAEIYHNDILNCGIYDFFFGDGGKNGEGICEQPG